MNVKHGLIIDELKKYIEKNNSNIFVYNTQKIDLISELNNSPLAIYKVKHLQVHNPYILLLANYLCILLD